MTGVLEVSRGVAVVGEARSGGVLQVWRGVAVVREARHDGGA